LQDADYDLIFPFLPDLFLIIHLNNIIRYTYFPTTAYKKMVVL
jgi:hypothetical protein